MHKEDERDRKGEMRVNDSRGEEERKKGTTNRRARESKRQILGGKGEREEAEG